MATPKELGGARVAKFLHGDGSLSLVPKIIAEHVDRTKPLDPHTLSGLYQAEISVPTANAGRYLELARALSEWMLQDFDRKLSRVTLGGRPTSLMLTPGRSVMDRTSARPVAITSLAEKLPKVLAKIMDGDMTRFVHLLGTVHTYGQCLVCGSTSVFRLAIPSELMFPMSLILETYTQPEPQWMETYRILPTWLPVIGFCTREQCTPVCHNCQQVVPTTLDTRWVTAQVEDRMCWVCASRQLVNVKRPRPGRIEQRKLGRLIIQ